jgi:hypothetical protein
VCVTIATIGEELSVDVCMVKGADTNSRLILILQEIYCTVINENMIYVYSVLENSRTEN